MSWSQSSIVHYIRDCSVQAYKEVMSNMKIKVLFGS
jgi:hypothetical protein